MGLWTSPDDLFTISFTGTASSNSNARTKVKSSAFSLSQSKISIINREQVTKKLYSTRAKRYPIQERGPPRNVSILPQTPPIEDASSGGDSHRSGLEFSKYTGHNFDKTNSWDVAHLNSNASSPQIDLDLLICKIGMLNDWPFWILRFDQQNNYEQIK